MKVRIGAGSAPRLSVCLIAIVAMGSGCGSTIENNTRSRLDEVGERQGYDEAPQAAGPREAFDGQREAYVRYALEHSPELRAEYETWRAEVYRISPARRLPDPMFTYGLFVQRVETRVGPQRHSFNLTQRFPWPTKLTAGAEAASLRAEAAQRRYEASALMVTRRVVSAYWKLWAIERTREVLRDQRILLQTLGTAARARVEIGEADLSDMVQVDLNESKLVDQTAGLDELERQQRAALIAAMGAPRDTEIPVVDASPPLWLPAESDDDLRAALAEHPKLGSLELLAASKVEQADSLEADRYPSFSVGVTFIETGEAAMPNVPDSGKDPVIVLLGISLPLWQGSYSDASEASHAEGVALSARKIATHSDALAELEHSLAALRDSTRRVLLYRDTLLPQAQTAYESVLGAYQTGRTGIASGLLAQKDLLEIQLSLFRAQAEHAGEWARLEEVVGRPVRGEEVSP